MAFLKKNITKGFFFRLQYTFNTKQECFFFISKVRSIFVYNLKMEFAKLPKTKTYKTLNKSVHVTSKAKETFVKSKYKLVVNLSSYFSLGFITKLIGSHSVVVTRLSLYGRKKLS